MWLCVKQYQHNLCYWTCPKIDSNASRVFSNSFSVDVVMCLTISTQPVLLNVFGIRFKRFARLKSNPLSNRGCAEIAKHNHISREAVTERVRKKADVWSMHSDLGHDKSNLRTQQSFVWEPMRARNLFHLTLSQVTFPSGHISFDLSPVTFPSGHI